MQKKLLAFDLDGTVIDGRGLVSRENIQALRAAAAAGVYTVVATGRTFEEIPEAIRQSGAVSYYIYSNGAAACDAKGQRLFFQGFAQAQAAAVYQMLQCGDPMLEVYADGRPYVQADKLCAEALAAYQIDPVYRPVILRTRVPVPALQPFFETDRHTEMLNVFFYTPKERDACLDSLRRYANTVSATFSMENNLEILPAGVHKGMALLRLCDALRMDPADAIAVGDSANDKEMLGCVGLPLAVSNAALPAKQAAKQTICSNDMHVLAYIVNNFIKI